MSIALAFFVPIVRLLGHQTAAAVCFAAVAFLSILPAAIVKVLHWISLSDWIDISGLLPIFSWLEKAILYTDLFLYGVSFVFSAVLFVVEEYHALKRLLKASQEDDDD